MGQRWKKEAMKSALKSSKKNECLWILDKSRLKKYTIRILVEILLFPLSLCEVDPYSIYTQENVFVYFICDDKYRMKMQSKCHKWLYNMVIYDLNYMVIMISKSDTHLCEPMEFVWNLNNWMRQYQSYSLHIFILCRTKARKKNLFRFKHFIVGQQVKLIELCLSIMKESFNQFWTIEYIITKRDYTNRYPFFSFISIGFQIRWNSFPQENQKSICIESSWYINSHTWVSLFGEEKINKCGANFILGLVSILLLTP